MSTLLGTLGLSLALTGVALAQGIVRVDPAIPSYQKVSGISGNLNSFGSEFGPRPDCHGPD